MSMYCLGRTSGLVVDSGCDVTNIVPVLDGYCITDAIENMSIAGKNLTSYAQKLLNESGQYQFQSIAEVEEVRKIKESVCFVAESQNGIEVVAQSGPEHDIGYRLPDDSEIIVQSKIRMQVPELFFQPELGGFN